MFVSIVVPTSRSERLGRCLASLRAQDYARDDYEIVVAANGPARSRISAAASSATAAPRTTVLELEKADANAARNAGIGAARGEVVCLVDDDVEAPPGWLAAIAAGASRHPAAGCFGGPIRPRYATRPPRTCARHELAGMTFDEGAEEREVGEVWGGNMALRRSAFEAVGPLAEGLRFQQEWEWQQRFLASGGRIVYLPDAWLWHLRLAADLELAGLLREHFLRGRAIGEVRVGLDPTTAARGTGRLLCAGLAEVAHGLGRCCARGLTDGAKSFGIAVGIRAGRGQPPSARDSSSR